MRFLKKSSGVYQKGRAWVEVDLESLRHNVATLKNMLPDGCELMPAVKADAYGHGALRICKELNRLGVNAFCVATVFEGVELCRQHIKGEILVLGYTHPELFEVARRHKLMLTVVDSEHARAMRAFGKKLRVHLAVDTGMHRLGEPAHNFDALLDMLASSNLSVEGIYSHLSAQSCAFTQTQVDRFNELPGKLQEHGFKAPKAHLQSSYGLLQRPDLHYSYARVGIALYGAYEHDSLRPVLSVKTRVSTVKTVARGEAIGYGLGCVAPRAMKIAVLSIGYADGLPRALSCGVGKVLIHGLFADILGYVCMDQTIVNISQITGVKQGDTAVILGQDKAASITALDIAAQLNTVPNEVLSRLGTRLPRVYFHFECKAESYSLCRPARSP